MNVAVFASGGGSNFQALVDAFRQSDLIDIALCVTNKADAGVIDRAHRSEIPSLVLSPVNFTSNEEYTASLLDHLKRYKINFIALAGYLKMIPEGLIAAYRNRIVNIHPSLLPAFGGKGMYGRRVHQAVIDSGAQWSGVTIHIVDEEYDTGPIVLQEPVPVDTTDTADTLAQRVLAVEHRLYPKALQLFADESLEIAGRRVIAKSKRST